MEDLRSLFEQDRLLQSASTSASVLVESFVRGAFGDPLGKANELVGSSQQLTGKGEQLQTRWSNMQQRIVAIGAQEIRLRATLSEKYGTEFPPLSPLHKREK